MKASIVSSPSKICRCTDLATRLRKDGLDRQQETHLLRLEDATLRIDERDAFAFENDTRLQLRRGQVIVDVS
jgi:hypothetical protein